MTDKSLDWINIAKLAGKHGIRYPTNASLESFLEEITSTSKGGQSINCVRCGGAGYHAVWSFGVNEPDECQDCGGSGQNWQYQNGTIARYYSGPLLGRGSKP